MHALCAEGALRVDQIADDVQTAETVGAIRDLLDIAAQRLQERRYDGAFEAYEAVLSLDRENRPMHTASTRISAGARSRPLDLFSACRQ